jgi:ketosteroid isomerase-like protein
MASANIDLVRSIYAASERGDFSTSPEWAHPEIEFVIGDGPSPSSRTGVAAMMGFWREFLHNWDDWRVEADKYLELDDDRVLVLNHFTGRGRTSGLEVARVRSSGAGLFHIRDRRVTRLVIYWDAERALADVGLPPQAAPPGS